MSSSALPSPDDDYAAPLNAYLNKAFWDAALKSVGARIRALEAVKAGWEELIAEGTGQALAVIQANVAPQIATLTAVINQLKADVALAEDAIAAIVSGGVNMSNVVGLSAALAGKASTASLDAAVAALVLSMTGYVSHAEAQALTADQKAQALSNLGLDSIHNALTPFVFMATAGQTVFDLGLSPSPNACIFFHNGAKLVGGGADYTIVGDMLTLTTPAAAGDTISGVVIGTFEVANAMLSAANLADLGSAAAARANLGLGSAAVENAGIAAHEVLKLGEAGKAAPSVFPSGAVIGRAYAEYTATATLTALIPYDDTPPLSSEGTQILSLSYTPKIVGSTIVVRATAVGSTSSSSGVGTVALFAGTACIGVGKLVVANSYYIDTTAVCGNITLNDLSPIAISVRAGAGSGNLYVNTDYNGIRKWGGAARWTLSVEEYAP